MIFVSGRIIVIIIIIITINVINDTTLGTHNNPVEVDLMITVTSNKSLEQLKSVYLPNVLRTLTKKKSQT